MEKLKNPLRFLSNKYEAERLTRTGAGGSYCTMQRAAVLFVWFRQLT